MNRPELLRYIEHNYGVKPEYPWIKYPDYAVLRHGGNKKWFAVIMGIPKNRLGLKGNEVADFVNFKCAPFVLDSFLGEKGCYPAYHMSKTNWITVALDGSVCADKIKMLLDMSFTLTERDSNPIKF